MTAKDDELVSLMRDVKRLLVLQLLQSGTPQGRIAAMLEISPATMSRMMPKGLSKSIARKGNGDEEVRHGRHTKKDPFRIGNDPKDQND